MSRSLNIAFLLFDGVKMLDVVGPAEVFSEANRLGAKYSVGYFSPSGPQVTTSIGLPVQMGGQGDGQPTGPLDTVIVPGSDDLPTKPIPPGLIDAVGSLQGRVRRVVSICTGAFVLASAGLLDGRQATTHWQHTELLAKAFPGVDVQPDALFVEDGGVFTSAGVSAGLDLALALVEHDEGAALARDVARNLVLFMQRPGGQSQFSGPLSVKAPEKQPLRTAVELISARPDLDYSAESLAAMIGLSSRQISRLFATELNTSPARFVEQMRLDHAKTLLAAGHSITKTAQASGFGSSESMRRTFNQRLRVSPSEYRARFQSATLNVNKAAGTAASLRP